MGKEPWSTDHAPRTKEPKNPHPPIVVHGS